METETWFWSVGDRKDSGHAFVVERNGEDVKLLDIASNGDYDSNIFKRFQEGSVSYCRIDQLEINDLGASACEKE